MQTCYVCGSVFALQDLVHVCLALPQTIKKYFTFFPSSSDDRESLYDELVFSSKTDKIFLSFTGSNIGHVSKKKQKQKLLSV